ncbi:MAG: FmdB family zinc ribbon protein [Gammaproteobacteria bacterium]
MPIYEYQCDICEHRLELIQKINEEPLSECPECGEDGLRKLISPVSFRLKGTGWYETDFKDKSGGKNKKPVKSTSDADKTSTTASDSGSKESSTASTDKKAATSSN